MQKFKVPFRDVSSHLAGYRAKPEPEYSNARRWVYFVPHMRMWLLVRKIGDSAELEFTSDCPCGYDG